MSRTISSSVTFIYTISSNWFWSDFRHLMVTTIVFTITPIIIIPEWLGENWYFLFVSCLVVGWHLCFKQLLSRNIYYQKTNRGQLIFSRTVMVMKKMSKEKDNIKHKWKTLEWPHRSITRAFRAPTKLV